ncbi:CDP-diacylglycerol diphosphatase [Paraburkholderia solisilvae]|uniref:CDP-diacylglycerol pyrophosphatase n=1 Tax=Paraburkholderia solisilvae TaxID=624376 RepID=A0A6J5DC37_9BURK|nr:CDP-diacylglycerol diphosphatase [Paraburkholderia solisilvae]CAB3750336.1 CDP-diacylglycerol pyrophosphatase [Paraburkholderia solisilvae]
MLQFLRKTLVFSLAVFAGGCATLAASNPDALWKIVHEQCVPAEQANGKPGVCTDVNLTKRYAILKDIVGDTQFLLIPTDRVTGIESPLILAPDAPDYWVDAWDSRHYVDERAKVQLPDNQIGLEINSQFRRSQNQLHIHIDCMREDVVAALAPYRDQVLDRWRPVTLDKQHYRVMRVTNLMAQNNPFRVVARDRPGSDQMAEQTIFVTSAGPTTRDGWLIVNSALNIEDGSGTAEPLLDHACKIAKHG